ncbi:MAG: hypothetical protein ACK56I_18255, partial [bacterium]
PKASSTTSAPPYLFCRHLEKQLALYQRMIALGALRYILRLLCPQPPHRHRGHAAFQHGCRLIHGFQHKQEAGHHPALLAALNTLSPAMRPWSSCPS